MITTYAITPGGGPATKVAFFDDGVDDGRTLVIFDNGDGSFVYVNQDGTAVDQNNNAVEPRSVLLAPDYDLRYVLTNGGTENNVVFEQIGNPKGEVYIHEWDTAAGAQLVDPNDVFSGVLNYQQTILDLYDVPGDRPYFSKADAGNFADGPNFIGFFHQTAFGFQFEQTAWTYRDDLLNDVAHTTFVQDFSAGGLHFESRSEKYVFFAAPNSLLIPPSVAPPLGAKINESITVNSVEEKNYFYKDGSLQLSQKFLHNADGTITLTDWYSTTPGGKQMLWRFDPGTGIATGSDGGGHTASFNANINALFNQPLQIFNNAGGSLVSHDGSSLVSHDGSSLVSHDGSSLVSHDGSSLVSHDGSSLVSHDGSSFQKLPGVLLAALVSHDGATLIAKLISNDGGSLVSHDGASLVSHDGATLVSHDGATLVSHDGATLVSHDGASILANAAEAWVNGVGGTGVAMAALISPAGLAALDIKNTLLGPHLISNDGGGIVGRQYTLQSLPDGIAAGETKIPDLVALYKFDNAADLGEDSSGRAGADLSATGGATFNANGRFGGALHLDGTGKLSTTDGSVAPAFPIVGDHYTISAWVKGSPTSTTQADFNAVQDFSLSANANGVWSYYAGGNLLTQAVHDNPSFPNIDYWWNGGTSPDSYVVGKPTGSVTTTNGTVILRPDHLNLDSQSASVSARFTAPTTGTYTITGDFITNDTSPHTHTVGILDNGASIFSGIISRPDEVLPFNLTLTLSAGETLDFVSNSGANGDWQFLSTGLKVTIDDLSTSNIPGRIVGWGDFGAGEANGLYVVDNNFGRGALNAWGGNNLFAAADVGSDPVGPNLVVNGGFEVQEGSDARTWILDSAHDHEGVFWRMSGTLDGWSLSSGRFELNTNNNRGDFDTGDGQVVVDLEADPAENAGIYQDIAGLEAGEAYRLSFDAANPLDGLGGAGNTTTATVRVFWNGVAVGEVTTTSRSMVTTTLDLVAAATGTGVGGANRLEFREVGAGSDARGTSLDNIIVRELASDYHHLTATYDGTVRRLYVDGVLTAQDNPGTADVGFEHFGLGEGFVGDIDNVAVFNRALTSEEVGQLQLGKFVEPTNGATVGAPNSHFLYFQTLESDFNDAGVWFTQPFGFIGEAAFVVADHTFGQGVSLTKMTLGGDTAAIVLDPSSSIVPETIVTTASGRSVLVGYDADAPGRTTFNTFFSDLALIGPDQVATTSSLQNTFGDAFARTGGFGITAESVAPNSAEGLNAVGRFYGPFFTPTTAGDFVLTSSTAGDQLKPVGVQLADGNVAIAFGQSGNSFGLSIVDPNGTVLHTETAAMPTLSAAVNKPSIDVLGSSDQIVVAYADRGPLEGGTHTVIRVQRFAPDGTPVGDPVRVGGIYDDLSHPVIRATYDGGYIVGAIATTINGVGARTDVHLDLFKFNSAGDLVASSKVGTPFDGVQELNDIRLAPDGELLVNVTGQRSDGTVTHTMSEIWSVLLVNNDDTVLTADPLNSGRQELIVAPVDSAHPLSLRGQDWVSGGKGGDYLEGSDRVSHLFGGPGDDTLRGQGGDDILYGGPGADTARMSDRYEHFDITRTVSSDGILLVHSKQVSFSTLGVDDGADTMVGIETIEFQDGRLDVALPVMRLRAPSDFGGNFTLKGDAPIDYLGNPDSNVVFGNAAANRFEGLGGSDTFTGGQGDDRLIFAPGGGADTFTDFAAGAATDDKIDLTAFTHIHTLDDVLSRASSTGINGAGTLIDLGNGDSIWLPTVAKANLHLNDFILNPSETITDPATGTSSTTTYDVNGDQPWSSQTQTFDNQGHQTSATVTYDDGSLQGATFDTTGQSWTSQNSVSNAAGQLTNMSVIYDDNTQQTAIFDTTGQSWKSQNAVYDSQGRQTVLGVIYDDGTVQTAVFDAAGDQLWKSQNAVYDALGRQTTLGVIYDDGHTEAAVFDAAEDQPWTSQSSVYEPAGHLIALSVKYDDGHVDNWHI